MRQRTITIALIAFAIGALAVRYFLDSREQFRTFTEPMNFTVTNDTVYFRGSKQNYMKTNADLAAMLRNTKAQSMFVTVRERTRRGRLVGWKIIEVEGADTR